MLVYRITVTKYDFGLKASGRAARWNPNDAEMIYTASSRSLACLENVVHRSQSGLNQNFSVMTIECPDSINILAITKRELSENWTDFDQIYKIQALGLGWLRRGESAILQVPSSIIGEEVNYLLNPAHADFRKLKIVKTQPFVFDSRIKVL